MPRNLVGRLTTGGLIVLVGLLLLLSTTDVVETESLWAWFPAVFVLLGAWALLASGFRNLTGPVMVVAIAGTFLLRNLGFVTDAAIGTWWPLFVVLFGLLLAVNRSRRRQRIRLRGTDAGEVTVLGVFGGGDRRITSAAFTGAEVVSVFGGSDVDLRDVTVPSPPAVVETLTLFGGTELRVPAEWNVRMDVLALFGDASDSRPRVSGNEAAPGRGDGPDLVVTGLVLFGGIEVLD